MGKPAKKAAVTENSEDRDCDRCGEGALIDIHGKANCHYCGNTVVLCRNCAIDLMRALPSLLAPADF